MPNQYKGAFHLHTTYSDGELTLEELKARFQKNGFQFLMMSDHAEAMDAERMKEYVAHCRRLSAKDFQIVPGLEFSYASPSAPGTHLHLLAYGIDRYERADEPVGMIHLIHKLGGLAVLAHPFPLHGPDYEAMTPFLDGIELWNTKYNGRFAPALWNYGLLNKARESRSSILGFYGTDFHWKAQYAGMSVRVEAEQLAGRSLLAALARGAFHGEKEEMVLASNGALTSTQELQFKKVEQRYRIWKKIIIGCRAPFKFLRLPIPKRLKAMARKTL